jgi:nucleoside phosphorylase
LYRLCIGGGGRSLHKGCGGFCSVTFVKSFDSKKREYHFATIQNDKGEPLKLHVSWPASYGLVEISLYLPANLREFRPRIAIMTGICAGDKLKAHLGDVVVADRAFIYDKGKVKPDQHGQPNLQPDVNTRHIQSQVLQAVRMFDGWKPFVTLLGHPLPECHIAAIASGNAVRSDNPFEQIQKAVRGTVAIDMEGAAFYRCVAEFTGMRALLVKGICDYGDDHKDDTLHTYAALSSALYALAFMKEYVTSTLIPRQIE